MPPNKHEGNEYKGSHVDQSVDTYYPYEQERCLNSKFGTIVIIGEQDYAIDVQWDQQLVKEGDTVFKSWAERSRLNYVYLLWNWN